MKTRKRFNLLLSTLLLIALLMPQSTTLSATQAPARGIIPFTKHVIADNFNYAQSVYATDLDGDGDVDVLGAAIYAGDIAWWENDGAENFTEHIIAADFTDAYSVYATDVDGDGDVDVLGAAGAVDDITWWENDGAESFTQHTIDGSFDGARSVYATDVDGDGDIDVLGAAWLADDIAWWENDGDENFTKHTIDTFFDGANAVYAIDVDGDGDMDVLGAAGWHDDITWWENDGDQNFTEHTIAADFNGACSVYAIDLDGDGDVDVLGTATYDSDITWWENDGSQNFIEHTIDDSFGGAQSVYAVDVDNDADVDVLGAAGAVDDITWWENDGAENFIKRTIDGDFDGASSVYATDVDGDGDVDVLGAANYADDIAWWDQGAPLEVVFLPMVFKNIGPPSSPPLLYEISNPDGHYSFTVSWSAVSGATSYTLEEDDNNAFPSPEVAYTGSYTSTSVYVGDVGTYYYRVKASNRFGSTDWSNIRSVVVTVEPTGPELGHYTGSPSVSFDVTAALQVCNYSIRVPFSSGYCRIRPGSCADITDNAFTFSRAEIGAIYTITGTFDSSVHALGRYRVSMCGDTIVIPASTGSWQASK